MTDDTSIANEDLDTRNREKKERKHDSGAADLERVTNYAEEKEIKSDANILSVINNVKRQEVADKVRHNGQINNLVWNCQEP